MARCAVTFQYLIDGFYELFIQSFDITATTPYLFICIEQDC